MPGPAPTIVETLTYEEKKRLFAIFVAGAAVIVILVSILSFLFALFRKATLKNLERRSEAIDRELASGEAGQLVASVARLEGFQAKLAAIEGQSTPWRGVIEGLGRLLPQEVQITSFTGKQPEARVEGVAPNLRSVAKLLAVINAQDYAKTSPFQSATLVSLSLAEGRVTFALSLRLKSASEIRKLSIQEAAPQPAPSQTEPTFGPEGQ